MPRLIRRFVVAVSVAVAVQGLAVLGADAPRLRVLLLTGRNNHNWRETTPVLKAILEDSGRFVVTVTEKPEESTGADFARHDVLLSNWNNFGAKEGQSDWPQEMRTAFLDYVRKGGGFVVVHAGGSMFAEWQEFQQLIGATWGKGTGHGPRHEFEVRLVGEHPVTKGLTTFRTTDELWHRMVVAGEPKALAVAFSAKEKSGTGQDEALVRVTEFGKGRCFNLTLGHNAAAMRALGFRALLLRGTEWAATGKVTIAASTVPGDADIDRMLVAISAHALGDGRERLVDVERLVYASMGSDALRARLEAKLAALLGTKASAKCQAFVCRQLSIIGTAQSIPALATVLADGKLRVHARAALERIPGDVAAEALRVALGRTSGTARVGFINSLGRRRDVESIPILAKLVTDAAPQTAGAALDALGAIGGLDALTALLGVPAVLDALGVRRSAALLVCAEGLSREGKVVAAKPVLAELVKPGQAGHIRTAAFPLHVATLGAGGNDAVLGALGGADLDLQRAAVQVLRQRPAADLSQAVAGRLPTLSPALQDQVIAVFADQGTLTAAPAIRKIAASGTPGVRRSAIVALGKLGDAETVPALAELSGMSDADGKRAVVEALTRLRGEGVNQAIARTAETAPEAVVCDLIQSLAARRAREMAPVLVGFARSDKTTVRTEALEALGEVGGKVACGELIRMLPKASGPDRSRGEDALVAICRREGTTEPLLEATARATGRQRVSLLSVLGKVGGEEARVMLVTAVKDEDADSRLAAVRALSGWDDASPLDALLAAATDSKDLRVRVLACRGIAALAGKAGKRSQGEMAGILGRAIAIAPRAEEKRTLLGALRTVRSRRALEVASANLGDPEVVDQAALAAVDVAEGIGVRSPALANAALEQVIARCSDPVVAARATSLLGMTGSSGNLAIGGKATSPDGLSKDGAAHGDQAAIDGDPATYWDEENDKKLYRLRVEMLVEAKVNRIKIVAWVHHQFSPRDFDILCDGKVVKSVKDAQYKGRDLEVRIPPTRCRVVELSITGYYPQSPAVRELEIYGMTDKPEGAPAPKPEGVADGLCQTATSLAYARDGRTLWRLNADPKEGKPYVHPLRLPNGGVLTDLRPADHVWHRALWFSWKYINGLNYWEEDKKTGLSDGRTTLRSSTTKAGEDGSAVCEQVLEYHRPDGPVLLSERRRIAFSAPAEDGSYRIDWTATFTAGDTEVKLDRTPLPHEPEGASYGGYAGFSARLGRDLVGGAFVNSEGGKGQSGTHGKAARWVDYTGQDGGITILDHPKNLRHPAPWYVAAGMPYFSPALLFRESLTLGAGQKMALRYRVDVHGPSPGTEWLENEWKQFAAE